MKKTKNKKHVLISKRIDVSGVHFIIIGLFTVLILGTAFIARYSAHPRVLGERIFLARGGDDGSGGNTQWGDTSANSISHASSGSNGNSGTVTNRNMPAGISNQTATIPANTNVDCMGPDNKHFQTSFQNCASLNLLWHHSNFSFTSLQIPPIQNPADQTQQPIQQIPHILLPSDGPENKIPGNMQHSHASGIENGNSDHLPDMHTNEASGESNVARINIEHGTIVVRTNHPDGKNIDLMKVPELKFSKIIDGIISDIEISTASANNLLIKNDGSEAETDLPVSVDLSTKNLTITTSTGTKTISVLPDQAIRALINKNIFSDVEMTTASETAEPIQKTQLTELNNQPVFKVNGVSNKRILGLFPIAFAKTAFVSASDGQLIKVDETLGSKLLEFLAF